LLDKRQLQGLLELVKNVSRQHVEGEEPVGDVFLTSVDELWTVLTTSEEMDEEARVKHPFSEDLATLLDQLW
jgi:hypothetical protein